MRVYLDTCVWLRPYDDQSQDRIRRETDSLRALLEAARLGEVTIVGSELVEEEIGRVPSSVEEVQELLSACSLRARPSDTTVATAKEIVAAFRLSTPDAVHICLAAEAGEHFLTCDDKLLAMAAKVERFLASKGYPLRIQSPAEFVEQWRKRKR